MRAVGATGRMVTLADPSTSVAAGGVIGLPGYSSSGHGAAGSGVVRLGARADGTRPSADYAAVARSNPWVMSAVSKRARPASRVQIGVYAPEGDGWRHVPSSEDSPAGELAWLLEHPDDGLSGRRWRQQVISDLLVHGNGVIHELFQRSRRVALRWHPFVDVESTPTDDGLRVESWRWASRRRQVRTLGLIPGSSAGTGDWDGPYAAGDVVHLTLLEDTDPPLGMSPMASLHATHALHDQVMRFATSFLDNGVFPSGMVEIDPRTSPEASQAVRELVTELYTSTDRAGTPFVAQGKWHQISATPEHAQLLELARWSREEVSAAYDIPMSAQTSTGTNKATADADDRRFNRHVVGSDVGVLVTELQTQLVDSEPRWAGLQLRPNMWELLAPDVTEMAKIIKDEVGAPVAVVNEGRKWIGLEPLDDPRADKLILPPGSPGEGGTTRDAEFAEAAAGTGMTVAELKARVDAAGVLVRSGWKPGPSLERVGLDPIDHTGLLPVTLKDDGEPSSDE